MPVTKEIQELEAEAKAYSKKLVSPDISDKVEKYLNSELEKVLEKIEALEARKEELDGKIAELKEEAVEPEDIRYIISSLAAEFDDLNPRQKQRIFVGGEGGSVPR